MRGHVSILRQLHDDLDRAVADAYGWPSNLTDPEILGRLVAPNAERVAAVERALKETAAIAALGVLLRTLQYRDPSQKDSLPTGISANRAHEKFSLHRAGSSQRQVEQLTSPAAATASHDISMASSKIGKAEWKAILRQHQQPSVARATWQIVNTFGTYVALWVAIYWSLAISWWLAVPLVLLAGGVLVRVFIIFHDCGHGSFFPSRVANDITGFVAGLLCFTPYYHWRWEHSLHHATSSDLDRRGVGDLWTMTVQEYLESSRWRRLAYRLARNPVVLFVIAPVFLFIVRERFPSPKANARERRSVWWMNLAVLALSVGLGSIFGFKTGLLLQVAVMAVGGAIGVWMFYVQHQFDGAYWERGEAWDYTAAALQGSSFYRLPKILQWFTGNIGFHHIHHLSPRVPNYNLERCHESHPIFQMVKPLTLLASFKTMKLHLWDEQRRELVSFRHVRRQGTPHEAA